MKFTRSGPSPAFTTRRVVRRRLYGLAVWALLFAWVGIAFAQSSPATAPIKLVVAWAPGGPTDNVARTVAQKLGEVLARRVYVENKAGASGMIGTESVVRATPDGNTLLMAVFQDVTRPELGMRQSFDVLKDLDPLIKVYDLPFVIAVNPSVLPVSTLAELIDYARKNRLVYASSSNGSMGHLSFELIAQQAGIKVEHIGYKGSAPALLDVLGGRVPMMYGDIVSLLPQIRSGKLKAIAVGSATRLNSLPNVPTVAESGFPGFVGTAWGGIVAPIGMAPQVRAQLIDALHRVMSSSDIISKMRDSGVEPATVADPNDFARFMKAEATKWSQVIKDGGIRVD
jgi:tripartite-type tricarboxylate transporter receptor subunit TctC